MGSLERWGAPASRRQVVASCRNPSRQCGLCESHSFTLGEGADGHVLIDNVAIHYGK